MKGKIYRLSNGDKHYYGSTTKDLKTRLSQHLYSFHDEREITSGVLFDSVEYKISIDLMEEIEYENKDDLLRLERWWIENNECVNKQIPIREEGEAYKEWYKKPESKIIRSVSNQRFRENNREKLRLQQKELRDKQKKDNTSTYEKIKQKRKEIIICECGCKTTKGTLKRHRKTKKHIKLMENKTENIKITITAEQQRHGQAD